MTPPREAAPTPRPWKAGARYGSLHTEIVSADGGRAVAYCWTYRRPNAAKDRKDIEADPEGKANLALIVAAANAYDPEALARVTAALELAATRLEILTDRMRGCHEITGRHELLSEAEAFCTEARAALAGTP
jgi:hypothetical protein